MSDRDPNGQAVAAASPLDGLPVARIDPGFLQDLITAVQARRAIQPERVARLLRHAQWLDARVRELEAP